MFGSSVIDIAIGIVFVFLLLSLIASTINEMIRSIFNARGKDLLRGLKMLLNDEKATGLVSEVYNHGLVFGLFEGDFNPEKPRTLPSYIPAQNFAAALIDVVLKNGDAREGQDSMLTALRSAAQTLAADSSKAKVAKPLIAMIDAAGADTEKLKKSIEDWYKSAMDRVSGRYKYRTQWYLLVLGTLLTIALNVDTLVVARHLSNDAALRQSLVAAAQETAKNPSPDQQKNPKPTDQAIKNNINHLQTLGLPIGWLSSAQLPKDDGDPDQRVWPKVGKWPAWVGGSLHKWPSIIVFHFWGWLLTAVAVSLGAPFWFDILNKFMVARSTVKPGQKSKENRP